MALSIFLFGFGFGIFATGWRLHRQHAAAERLLAETRSHADRLLAFAPDLVLRLHGSSVQLSGRRRDLFGCDQDRLEGALTDVIAPADIAALQNENAICRFRLLLPEDGIHDAEGLWLGPEPDGSRKLAIRLLPPRDAVAPATPLPVPVPVPVAEPEPASAPPIAAASDADPACFSLALFADECIAAVAPRAAGKHLDLKVDLSRDLPAAVRGDEKAVRRLVLRLLDEVVARTNSGIVALTLRPAGAVRVRFEASAHPAVDATSATTMQESADHGLAALGAVVAELGGTSGVGPGVAGWFELDLPPAALTTRLPQSAERASSPPALHILVVEDDALNRGLVSQLLLTRGHAVDMVPDGGEAVMALQQGVYDLVLMDVQLPTVDGLTATRMIRNLALPARFTPIVAMTAAVLEQQVHAARRAGMDAVLPKPVSIASLEALVDRAARDQIRPPADRNVYDAAVAQRLAGSIGGHKVVEMQRLLARTLCARFTQPVGDETVAALKADAHACIPGAAMLGFTRLSERCRVFIDAAEPDALEAAYAALRQDLYNTVRMIDLILREDEAQTAA